MATEMGAIIIFFPPSEKIIDYCRQRLKTDFTPVYADPDASYARVTEIDLSDFRPLVSRPGQPHDAIDATDLYGQKIDSAFIGSCTNGRMEDMQKTADILKGRKVAPGVVLKIVPATDNVWNSCLNTGLIEIFKRAGALVSNAGCAGCAEGQVGQNGLGEVTISTGNRNFPGKQGKGDVYLASPAVVAASAVSGFITTPDRIPDKPAVFVTVPGASNSDSIPKSRKPGKKTSMVEGKTWLIQKDNIDTDMIFHNRHLSITDIKEMGQYTFGNLKGFERFASEALPGDIVIAGKNFGSGSSRQQAVDCFISLGIQAIVAESFGVIYERNAINAAFPIVICKSIPDLDLTANDRIRIDFLTGKITNLRTNKHVSSEPFSEVQFEIYQNGGLL